MISFDGANRLVTISGQSAFTALEIYSAAMQWAASSANMIYPAPMEASGFSQLSLGVYTDMIFVLKSGWKLKPSGYASNSQISITGTLITDDSSARTVPPSVGSPPAWVFTVATNATVITVTSLSALAAPTTSLNGSV